MIASAEKTNSEIESGASSVLEWNEDDLPQLNYTKLGERLALGGDIFRPEEATSGLLLVQNDGDHRRINNAKDLAAVIVDRIPLQVYSDGKPKGGRIPNYHLETMLRAEVFRSCFRTVETVSKTPRFMSDFALTRPGLNDGGTHSSVFYVGDSPTVSDTTETIDKFLDVMSFASNADRTNAVAAALTVLLRNHWTGGKPIVTVTATKSHAGKDTVLAFASNENDSVSISYQSTNWAFERSFVGALASNSDAAVVVVENARLDRRDHYLASAFLERFATDPKPLLFSTGTGAAVHRRNDVVTAISTNFGTVSEDIANRSLPIHLNPTGNVADRQSPIGNPRLEFLPQNKHRIAAELRGMVLRWKDAGMPLDDTVKHPFSPWAKTIGGILKANGYRDFLANYGKRKTTDDPLRQGVSVLGAARPDCWLKPDELARLVVQLGLVKAIIPPADQDSGAGRVRGIGVVLSNHRDETFEVETDTHKVHLRLEKARRRWDGASPHVRYRFVTLSQSELPTDAESVVSQIQEN